MKYVFFHFIILFSLQVKTQTTSLTFSPAGVEKLENTLDSIMGYYELRGASCAMIVPGQGTWIGTSGVSYDTVVVTPDMKFNIGSNTKLFTAVCIMKLEEMGLLDIDDAIGEYLYPIENVDPSITIKQLLRHESGIFDIINDDLDFLLAILADSNYAWEPEEQLEFIDAPTFSSGEGYSYSNTNYLLAGLIIESVTGDDYVNVLHEFILDPLDMDSTFMAYWEPPAYPVSHIFFGAADQGDEPLPYFSIGWSYGGLFSTAREIAAWYSALFNYEIISAASLQEIININEFSYAGLGLYKYNFQNPVSNFQNYSGYAHRGDFLNFHSQVFYDVDTKTTICLLTNDDEAFGLCDTIMGALTQILHSTIISSENDAGVSTIINPENSTCWSEIIPEITIYNYGTNNLTTLDINYGFTGYVTNTYSWTGNLFPNTGSNVLLPEISIENGYQSFSAFTTLPNGSADSHTFNDSVLVRTNIETEVLVTAPFIEDFESGEVVFNTWVNKANEYENGYLNGTWVIQDLSSYSGNKCLAKNNWDDNTGTYDDLESPVIDISGLTNPVLSFQYAYAEYPGSNDRLQVYISTDCGATFMNVFNKSGATLATTSPAYEYFFADSSQFVLESIDLTDFSGDDIVVKFRVTPTFLGQSLFVDDIKVDNEVVEIENITYENNISVNPNPFIDYSTIQFKENISDGELIIYNIMGEKVSTIENISGNKIIIARNNLPSGNYGIQLFDRNRLIATAHIIME
ncbi:MAG: serine hydrolase [Fimbriimonadaceae bacterium]|nr:serine hydrolase [Chitinophagales bacterium]